MSKFFSVRCKCGQKAIIFSNAATQVKCPACGTVLANPTGGRALIKAKIMEVLQ